jgi:hypothetical protein
MTEYAELPSALGASLAYVAVKQCDYCGEIFSTIFDEADHLLDEMDGEPFDPYYPLGESSAIRMGNLMRTFYDNADDPDMIRELSEEIYSILLVAEFHPHKLSSELDELLNEDI